MAHSRPHAWEEGTQCAGTVEAGNGPRAKKGSTWRCQFRQGLGRRLHSGRPADPTVESNPEAAAIEQNHQGPTKPEKQKEADGHWALVQRQQNPGLCHTEWEEWESQPRAISLNRETRHVTEASSREAHGSQTARMKKLLEALVSSVKGEIPCTKPKGKRQGKVGGGERRR